MAFREDALQTQLSTVHACMTNLAVNCALRITATATEFVMVENFQGAAANAFDATVHLIIVLLKITQNQLTNIRFIAETSPIRAL